MEQRKPTRRSRYSTPADRIHRNVAIDEATGCWNWQLNIHREGYGSFTMNGADRTTKFWLAHRFSYMTLVGPIPDGLEIDHLCRNRRCVNPAHLEAVTKLVNVRRGTRWANRPDHCKRGHAFDETNTGTGATGHRYCLTCAKASRRRSYERRMFRAAGIEVSA